MIIDRPPVNSTPRPQPPDDPDWHDQLVALLDLAYEAAYDLADQAEADFDTIGAPIEKALHILRDLRP